MRIKLFTISCFVLFAINIGFAQWTKLKYPETASIISIHKISGTKIILAGHQSYGILRSTDNGSTWGESNKGTEFRGCSPSKFVQIGTRIFALCQNISSNISSTDAYPYFSDDNGVTWKDLNASAGFGVINDTLYAGMPNSSYISRSTDNGTNWQNFIPSNLGTLVNTVIFDLACSNGNIIVGMFQSGIFYSKDGAKTFTKSTDVNGTVRSLYTIDSYVYAVLSDGNVYRSSNGGVNWTSAGQIPSNAYSFCRIVKMGNTLFGGSTSGLYSTLINDGNWQQIPVSGANSTAVLSLCADGSTLYIGSTTGFYKSLDSGKTWIKQNTGLFHGNFNVLRSYGSDFYLGSSSGELFKSTNYGTNWTLLNDTVRLTINDVAVNKGRIFVSGSGLQTSTNNGKTWQSSSSTNLPSYSTLDCFDVFNDTVYAYYNGLIGGSGIYKTPDGINWTSAANNLPGKKVTKLINTGSSFIALLQDSGIYRRTTSSNSWSRSLSKAKRVYASGTELYASVADTFIYHSSDGGGNWDLIGPGAYEYPYYADRVWKAKDTLYAYNSNFDLFVSGNNGKDWKNIKNEIYDIKLSFSDGVSILGVHNNLLYFNSAYNGLFIRGNIPTFVSKQNITIPEKMQLGQNYPNPFNPTTTISYQLSVNSYTTLKVYDVLGKEVAILVNQEQLPGSYSIQFDASNLSSGLYFYKLQAGNNFETKRMLMLK
jgi:photosystem II stability/assembly factor-like uncharacterized protein